MKRKLLSLLGASVFFFACGDETSPTAVKQNDQKQPVVENTAVAVDYSAGRAMNKRLGYGINLGNSWESAGGGINQHTDAGWGNPIQDGDFKIIKDAGFNSVRIPVRWQYDSDYNTHTLNQMRLDSVKKDVSLAIEQGLAVLLDFHHYTELNELGSDASKGNAEALVEFEEERAHFNALWAQIAQEFESFPDSMLAYDILNEPTIPSADLVNEIYTGAYEVIRKNAPGKTIVFESNQAAKFAQLEILKLPQDGNIIFSGHYYEPYNYSHQGHSDMYKCYGDANYDNIALSQFKSYVSLAQKLYPDVNGGHVPMNIGEFGISGPTGPCGNKGPSDAKKALWARLTVEAAEKYEMSWHYWGFTLAGGFEAYNRSGDTWYPFFPEFLTGKTVEAAN